MTYSSHRLDVALALVAALLAVGCASTRRPDATPGASATRDASPRAPSRVAAPDLATPGLEETALLLLLVDRQLYEPFSIGRVLGDRREELRRQLGAMLARVPDPRALPALEELAIDPDRQVRLQAAFAASRIAGREATALLEALLLDADDEVAAWACRGLAVAGVTLDRVATRLASLPREARQARLLPDLHRFAAARGGGAVFEAIALEGLEAADPWLRRRALDALRNGARPAQRPVFRRLLSDADAGVRALAAAGLGSVGDATDLEALRLASGDRELAPAIAAIDAAAEIVRAGRAAPPAAWRATLLERIADPRPAARAAAISASGAWLLDPALEAALGAVLEAGAPAERARAIVALGGARSARAGELVVAAARDPEATVRAAAAHAAGLLEARTVLDRLSTDVASAVREAAFLALAHFDPRPSAELHARFLVDPSIGVRAAVLERLAEQPLLPFEPLLTAFAVDERAAPELALAGVAALRARASTTPAERGSIVAALEGLAEVGTYPVRVESADALVALDRPRPGLGPATTKRSPGDYRSVAARTRQARWARLETSRGDAILRLDLASAPLSSIAFLQLAEQGFYDGSAVYRVTPGARLEAGDPDGDGRGGPGFTLRDEPGPRRLRAGAFGLVRPAPHASGSRFFVQLDDGPELEGEVTALGEVVAGLDVLAALLEGDRLVGLREIPPPPELHSGARP